MQAKNGNIKETRQLSVFTSPGRIKKLLRAVGGQYRGAAEFDGKAVFGMCVMCLKTPCDPRCPNAPESAGKFKCCECGYPIFEDEKYFDSENGAICEECLEKKTAKEIIELCGETLTVA